MRKIRKKYGKLHQSDHTDLSEMLEHHRQEVQDLLRQKRVEYEEERRLAALADEEQQGLRSPPLPVSTPVKRLNNGNGRTGGISSPTSPKLPQMGYFSVGSPDPRSPRSPAPLRRGY